MPAKQFKKKKKKNLPLLFGYPALINLSSFEAIQPFLTFSLPAQQFMNESQTIF
jgi:hypothetical protein